MDVYLCGDKDKDTGLVHETLRMCLRAGANSWTRRSGTCNVGVQLLASALTNATFLGRAEGEPGREAEHRRVSLLGQG